jgi:tryptophan 7-dimethylallyltransferase
MAKAYFVPQLKATYTGVSQNKVVFDSIRSWSKAYSSSVAALESHLESLPSDQNPQPFLVAIDCDNSPTSRIKVYLNNTSVDTLAKAKDMFCLGGRLSSPTIAGGIKAIEEWWYHIFELNGQADDQKVLFDGLSCVFAFELRPTEEGQDPEIDVKLHVPVWVLGKTDAQISERLSAWFKTRNHDAFADRYLEDLEYAL